MKDFICTMGATVIFLYLWIDAAPATLFANQLWA